MIRLRRQSETKPGDAAVEIDSSPVLRLPVVRKSAGDDRDVDDAIAVESPLQINVVWTKRGRRIERPVSVTMRTPGRDEDLAIGFLIAEGVIGDLDDVDHCVGGPNQIDVVFRDGVVVELCDLHRRGTTTSACGVCGKTSIDQIRVRVALPLRSGDPPINAAMLCGLSDELRALQPIFAQTGGLHGCGLFARDGQCFGSAEDVGRHNALDKLIGDVMRRCPAKLADSVLMLSGRISFELVQKSLVAGIPIVAAVGAPSSLAIQTASEFGQTLVGFVKNDRANVYCGADRIV